MRHPLSLLIAALLLALPAAASATTYELSSGGSLNTQANKLVAGDTLIVHGGTYNFRESYSWGRANGTAAAPITVKAAPGETPVFDGGMVSGEFWIPSGRSYWVLDGLTVQRFDNSSGNGAITPSNGSHHLEFRNMTFRDNGSRIDNDHDIYIGGCSSSCRVHDVFIHHNRFINGPGGALHMWHYMEGYNVFFYDNLVINKRVGVYACDDAENVRIYHNTFVSTSNTGGTTFRTSCGEVKGPKSVYVRNNVIYRSAGTVWERGGDLLVEDHNLIFGGNVSWTLDSTDRRVDPQFMDLAGGDYRLRDTSPAIDAGTATDAAADDFVYAPRPQGAGYDMGAYEANGTAPPPPPPPPPTGTTLSADADTYVDIATPTTNYGSAVRMTMYGGSSCYRNACGRILVDFKGVPSSATSATLRIYAAAASSEGVEVSKIDQGCQWTWDQVNWNTRPDLGDAVATRASLTAGYNDIALPVSSLTTPQRSGESGHSCFYVTKPGGERVTVDSLSAPNPPKLVIG